MKLVRFKQTGEIQNGIVVDDRVFALNDLISNAPKEMQDVIANWEKVSADVEANGFKCESVKLDDVTLCAPIRLPNKILAMGLNYLDHIEENDVKKPTNQVWFCKHNNAVNGPYDGVEMPKVSKNLDYEVELVAVIGKRGRHISREDAASHVFGYTVGNDVSVRDWQIQTPQWMLGKSFDTHCPFGPWIMTSDEVGDPHTLGIRSIINGEVRQDSNTKFLLYNIWDQIVHLSQAMTLEPGDMIFTGTPGGVGFAYKPPKFLKVNDVVRCEIDRIGAIENIIVKEA